ncbi:PREDICTED: uncharacterized protein LOC105563574 [Vollenhovia emeryi]|uniref:uncharacterized protein LOC105563574 n=1 Tax=Vollenhovia emeryi TaxID=411798 RepID=UPI0005F515F4|nr:PREDICTED: uncharacterized protein LOC105563574 [Vollenhovia emeryi]
MSKEARISAQEMTQYRERLMGQKEFLTDILSKIDKQILALQVERLHLRNTLLGAEYPGREILPDASTKDKLMKIEPVDDAPDLTKQLDLSVAPLVNNSEESEDDEPM